jgi:hypothetical protein
MMTNLFFGSRHHITIQYIFCLEFPLRNGFNSLAVGGGLRTTTLINLLSQSHCIFSFKMRNKSTKKATVIAPVLSAV